MRELFILVAHLLATLAKLLRPGGVRSVIAESLLLKHQLLTLKRSRKRAPRLTPWDRLLVGFGLACVSPARVPRIAIALRPSTFLRFHQALAKLKYHVLYASRCRQPGPKGPSRELIAAIVEIKRRNPRFGCPKMAQQISHTFGVEIDKDVVRRVLARHYRPDDAGSNGPSWLTSIGHVKDSLWCRGLF